jgi:hypothetical protein
LALSKSKEPRAELYKSYKELIATEYNAEGSMRFRAWFVFGAIVLLWAGSVCAQSDETMNAMLDNEVVAEPPMIPDVAPPAVEPVVDPGSDNKEGSSATVPPQWVWGEVVAVDPASGTLEIKHLDYETYEEVKKTITISKSTVFENVTDLSGVKPGDKVTIDYRPQDGFKVADMIVVEIETGAAEPVGVVPVEPVALTEASPMNIETPSDMEAPSNLEMPSNTEMSSNTELPPVNVEASE